MHTAEVIGAVALGGGFAGALITGFVLYLANHGVQPVPNPSPWRRRRREERDAYLARYNERYIAVTRVAFYVTAVVGGVGLILLVFGLVRS